MGGLSTLFYGVIALGGVYAAWASFLQDRGYPLTVEQAGARLDDMDFSESMLLRFNVKRTSETRAGGSKQLRWTFSARGKGGGGGTASCTALLTPIDPRKTDARFDCVPDGPRPDMKMAKAGAGLVKVLFNEHFNAALEGRKTSAATFGMAASTYAVTMQPMLTNRMRPPDNDSD